jgi:hypothetical protein
MSMQLKPETERLVDELIVQGVCAWREKHHVDESEETPAPSCAPKLRMR